MKPRNKAEKAVIALGEKLKAITKTEENWIIKNTRTHFQVSRNRVFCLECGHKDIESNFISVKNHKLRCPNCKKHLQRAKERSEFAYFAKFFIKENYQIISIYGCEKFYHLKSPATIHIYKVIDHYINLNNGKLITTNRLFNDWANSWKLHSFLEVRQNSRLQNYIQNISGYQILPKCIIAPIISRNGFRLSVLLNHFSDAVVMSYLLKDNFFEFLYKSDQLKLANDYLHNPEEVKRYKKSILVCIRHNYAIKKWVIWKDLIDALIYFGKDVLNPFYVCPENLDKAHDKWVDKKRAVLKKIELQEKIAQIAADDEVYQRIKKPFLNIKIQEKDISIAPLQNVQEFYDLGETLCNCLFTNNYYKKDTLILAAKINEEPIEVIELDTKQLKVKQCHGKKNKKTPHQKEILSVLNNNLKIFKTNERKRQINNYKIF